MARSTCAREGCDTLAKPYKKYCSPECYHLASVGHQAYNAIELEFNVCPACGTRFPVGGRGRPKRSQIYCTNTCSGRGQFKTAAEARPLTMPQAAYIAGLADGEGSFILFRRPYGVGMRLTLTSTNRRVLDWLVETTGVGSIVQQRRASEKHSQCWIWQVNAQAAATVIRQIRPYLVIKPDQADLALRVQDRQGSLTPEERETALTAMRALNARGPRP